MGRVMLVVIALNIFTNIFIVCRALGLKVKSNLRERHIRKIIQRKMKHKASSLPNQTKI
jgi:hypothetical protein